MVNLNGTGSLQMFAYIIPPDQEGWRNAQYAYEETISLNERGKLSILDISLALTHVHQPQQDLSMGRECRLAVIVLYLSDIFLTIDL
jgi:hypothetical protein